MRLTTKLPSVVRRDALMHLHNVVAEKDPGAALRVALQVAHVSQTECTMTSANHQRENINAWSRQRLLRLPRRIKVRKEARTRMRRMEARARMRMMKMEARTRMTMMRMEAMTRMRMMRE